MPNMVISIQFIRIQVCANAIFSQRISIVFYIAISLFLTPSLYYCLKMNWRTDTLAILQILDAFAQINDEILHQFVFKTMTKEVCLCVKVLFSSPTIEKWECSISFTCINLNENESYSKVIAVCLNKCLELRILDASRCNFSPCFTVW